MTKPCLIKQSGPFGRPGFLERTSWSAYKTAVLVVLDWALMAALWGPVKGLTYLGWQLFSVSVLALFERLVRASMN